ncbi:MAG: hypothetical protein JWP61_1682 [Friedmanniella sp.]|nr:hypothetical protein [Friedmanniella sp.]
MSPRTGRHHLWTSLVEDVDLAARHLVLVTVGGSVVVPRFARKLLYRATGAHLASPPGAGFVFRGSGRHLTLGAGVYMNDRVSIEALAPVTIGAGSALGMEVLILTSHHPLTPDGRWQEAAEGRPVSIGERVWIGARAIILPGAVIDDDVVVAAGAVVSGHLRSGGVYAGVPARRIRELTAPTPAGDAAADG